MGRGRRRAYPASLRVGIRRGYGAGWRPSLGVLSGAIYPKGHPIRKLATRASWPTRGNIRIKGEISGSITAATPACSPLMRFDPGNGPVDCAIDTNRAGRLRNRQGRAGAAEGRDGFGEWLPVASNGGLGVELRSRSGGSGSGVASGAVSGVTASAVDRGGCCVSS